MELAGVPQDTTPHPNAKMTTDPTTSGATPRILPIAQPPYGYEQAADAGTHVDEMRNQMQFRPQFTGTPDD